MADVNTSTYPVNITSVFDVTAIAGTTDDTTRRMSYSHITITTDLDATGLEEWALRAIVNPPTNDAITIDATYFLSGRLIGNNAKLAEYMLYDPIYTLISKTPTFQPAEIVNCVGITSLGHLLSVESSLNVQGDPLFVLIVEHSDINPVASTYHTFTVEYRAPRSNLDEDTISHLVANAEVFCAGSFVERNELTNRWIIEVTKLAITAANQNPDIEEELHSLQL